MPGECLVFLFPSRRVYSSYILVINEALLRQSTESFLSAGAEGAVVPFSGPCFSQGH